MNTLFLCRFDRAPRQEVNNTIMKFATDKPEFMSAPGCLITIFHTNSELQEVDQHLKAVNPPVAYFLMDISEKNIELNFPEEFAIPLANYMGLYKYKNKDKLHKLNIEDLEKLLQECLELEDYEKAAKIRNQINELQK